MPPTDKFTSIERQPEASSLREGEKKKKKCSACTWNFLYKLPWVAGGCWSPSRLLWVDSGATSWTLMHRQGKSFQSQAKQTIMISCCCFFLCFFLPETNIVAKGQRDTKAINLNNILCCCPGVSWGYRWENTEFCACLSCNFAAHDSVDSLKESPVWHEEQMRRTDNRSDGGNLFLKGDQAGIDFFFSCRCDRPRVDNVLVRETFIFPGGSLMIPVCHSDCLWLQQNLQRLRPVISAVDCCTQIVSCEYCLIICT